MLWAENVFSLWTQWEWMRGNWKGNIDRQSRLERWRGFQGVEDDWVRRRVCKRVKEDRVERGNPEQNLQMFYSKGEIIACSWFHLILLLLTGKIRRELGFPLACSFAIDLMSMVHTTVWMNEVESTARFSAGKCLLFSYIVVAGVTVTCECKQMCPNECDVWCEINNFCHSWDRTLALRH